MIRILIVDDSQDRVNELLLRIGSHTNVSVYWASSVAEAQTIIQSRPEFDIIMLDNDMGKGGEGTNLTKWITKGNYCPKATYIVHSMNPVANKTIVNILKDAHREAFSVPKAWSRARVLQNTIHFSKYSA